MKILEQAELVEVTYNDAKVTLTFLDQEMGEIREVNLNKKAYDKDTQKFVDNAEKAAQVDAWCDQFFGLAFDKLVNAVGQRHTVYCYDKFNSLFESNVKQVAKFDEDYVGQILNGTIEDVQVEEEGIRIFINHDGETYRNNMSFSKLIGGKWYVDPIKRAKQIEKFAEKFHVTTAKSADLIGKSVMFEVKKMGGSNAIYIDVKPFPKKKAK